MTGRDDPSPDELDERIAAIERKLDQHDLELGLYGPVVQFGAIMWRLIKWPLAVLIVLGLVALAIILTN